MLRVRQLSNSDFTNKVFCKVVGIRATVLPDGRWLLHDIEQNAITTLNAPAGILWELCDGQTTVASVVNQLQEIYPETPHKTLQDEVVGTLPMLVEQGLIEDAFT